ncbi:hypothetical protein ACWKT3_35365 [Streptomyces violaceus]
MAGREHAHVTARYEADVRPGPGRAGPPHERTVQISDTVLMPGQLTVPRAQGRASA